MITEPKRTNESRDVGKPASLTTKLCPPALSRWRGRRCLAKSFGSGSRILRHIASNFSVTGRVESVLGGTEKHREWVGVAKHCYGERPTVSRSTQNCVGTGNDAARKMAGIARTRRRLFVRSRRCRPRMSETTMVALKELGWQMARSMERLSPTKQAQLRREMYERITGKVFR